MDTVNNELSVLSTKVNRSKSQLEFLFNLVDRDLDKLKSLEVQIKNCFVGYCPGTKEDVEYVMKMQPKTDYFKL